MFPAQLEAGYRAFLEDRFVRERRRYETVAQGQSPEVMVIGCCDSRVSPEVIFDASPGELFVVRNVANLVPPYTPDGAQRAVSAALEFSVVSLKVTHIVVLGHARCGGVRAFAERGAPPSPGDFIGPWMELLAPAAASIDPPQQHSSFDDYLTHLEHASAIHALKNLMTFPFVRTLAERGRLHLHAAYFDVATGLLSVFDPQSQTFASITGADHRSQHFP